MYVKTAVLLCVWLLLYVLVHAAPLPLWWAALPLSAVWGVCSAMVGFSVMHDGNHGAYSDSALVNRAAGASFDLLGGSSYVWRMIHQVGHHVHTNVAERDPDIHTADPHFRRIKPQQPFYTWYRLQVWYLPVLYATLIFELYLRDFAAMALGRWGGVRFQPVPPREWALFAFAKAWYIVYNVLIPLHFHPLGRVLLLYAVSSIVAGLLTVMMFQVNHVTALAAQFSVDRSTGTVHEDWAVSQVRGSSNFASGSVLWNHLSGGLNHQIEHHLFPTVCHVHYPALSRIVQKTCAEYGIPYNSYSSFWTAIKGHFEHLRNMSSQGYVLDLSKSKML